DARKSNRFRDFRHDILRRMRKQLRKSVLRAICEAVSVDDAMLMRNDCALRLRQVALLIDTSDAYGRGLIRGVGKFNREHGLWSTSLAANWIEDWRGDGVLLRLD